MGEGKQELQSLKKPRTSKERPSRSTPSKGKLLLGTLRGYPSMTSSRMSEAVSGGIVEEVALLHLFVDNVIFSIKGD